MSDRNGADPLVRVDKWLWAARFFKTRSLAGQAVRGGKVHINNERARPARQVRIGDVVRITRGDVQFTVTVCGIAQRRGPAPEARQLYEETGQSRQAREQRAEQQRLARLTTPQPERRPERRARRALRRFKQETDF